MIRNKKKQVLVISIIFVLIFLLELVFRLTADQKLSRQHKFHYQPDSLIGYRYEINYNGTKHDNVIHSNYQINKFGFPGENFSINKPDSIYRVILIGSSDDTGINTNGIGYTTLLQRYLKKDSINVELINCSTDGARRGAYHIKLIEQECIMYNPDLILMRASFPLGNDLYYRITYKGFRIKFRFYDTLLFSEAIKFVDDNITDRNLLLKGFDYSYIYRYMFKVYYDNNEKRRKAGKKTLKFINKENYKALEAYSRGRFMWGPEVERPKYLDIQNSKTIYQELKNKLDSCNIKFMVFNTYSYPSYTNMTNDFKELGIGYLNLNIPFKEGYDYGKRNSHSSKLGHEVIAKEFYKVLTDSIIPENYFQ